MRWADLDLLGHVNNVTYVDYLQEARVDLLRLHAPGARAADLAEGVLVVRTDITYLAPLEFRFGTVSIDTWVSQIRAASFTVEYEIFDEIAGERVVYAQASTVLAPYVFETAAPRRLTPQERERLQAVYDPTTTTFESSSPVERVPPAALGHYAVQVRFSDIDEYRHVNNVKYFVYFQEGRGQLFTRLAERAGKGSFTRSVVATTSVEYRRPLLYRAEPYDLWCTVSRVGRTSLEMVAEISDGDQLCARSQAVMVFWDPDTGRSTEPPAALRTVIEDIVTAR